MKKFDAWGLAKLLGHIQTAERQTQRYCEMGDGDKKATADHLDLFVDGTVKIAQIFANDLGLTSAFNRSHGNTLSQAKLFGITNNTLVNELRVLRECIEDDLGEHHFVWIEPDGFKLLLKMEEDWALIWKKIPRCRIDSEEALHCNMFKRGTAVVFHAMRIAEHGLRRLARRLSVTYTHSGTNQPLELADWNDVITGINNKIKAARALPRSTKRPKQLEMYSDAADHCTYMKDIWRNNVSHSRKKYNPTEALGVLERVKDFMDYLARIL